MKYLVMIFLLVGCSKEQACKVFDGVPKIIAKGLANEGGCDASLIQADLESAIKSLPICKQDDQVLKPNSLVELNSQSPTCKLVGMTASLVDSGAMLRWKCKKGFSLDELLAKAFKCE